MEFENSIASSPHLYMTAPNSPSEYSRSNNSMQFYYSAPASPRRRAADDHLHLQSNFDDFEFDTSKRFSSHLHSPASESPASGRGSVGKHRERCDSLPAMAFADELFVNGLVMPLKPPPRLHFDNDFNSFGHKSPLSSPKSPRTVCRLPFARKNSWNDDFDPFMVALEKVKEEKRGRNSHHRRSRSYSPFRAMSKSSSLTGDSQSQSQDLSSGNSPTEPMASYSGPLDFKGSAYARWVRDQTTHGLSPKSPRGFLFRQRVRPVKTEPVFSDKPTPPIAKHGEESKVKKLKGLLVRYASFGRGNGKKMSSEGRKMSYFGRVSFKFKGSGQSNSKKKIPADNKMAVVLYKPSIASCLGYGVGNTVKAK